MVFVDSGFNSFQFMTEILPLTFISGTKYIVKSSYEKQNIFLFLFCLAVSKLSGFHLLDHYNLKIEVSDDLHNCCDLTSGRINQNLA